MAIGSQRSISQKLPYAGYRVLANEHRPKRAAASPDTVEAVAGGVASLNSPFRRTLREGRRRRRSSRS